MALDKTGEHRLINFIVTSGIAFIAVVLRFWCKFKLQGSIQSDDWWILVCLLAWLGNVSVLIWGIFGGSGEEDVPVVALELQQNPSPQRLLALENYLESLSITLPISFIVLYAAKISICLLYRRIFPTPRYRLMASILMGIATAWIVAAVVAALVYCIPIDAFWHHDKNGKCLNFNVMFLAVSAPDIAIDTAILALPIWAVLTVQMSLKLRFDVGTIFLLGGLSIITNILRVYYTCLSGTDFIRVDNSELWINIHVAVTVVCACLPVYKPLRVKFHMLVDKIQRNLSSLIRSRGASQRTSGGDPQSQLNSDLGLDDLGGSSTTKWNRQKNNCNGNSVEDLIVRPNDGINIVVISRNEMASDMGHIPSGSIGCVRKVEVV